MADEASVILSAINNVSGPVSEATASLAKYQAAMDSMASLEGRSAASAAVATDGINNVSAAAAGSVVPHRAAHQALALVSGSMVELAGGSAAAGGAVRVLDSVMFAMAATGGAVSLAFIGVIAAAAAIGYAFKSSAEETKKQQEALDKLTESTIKSVSGLEYLDKAQKSVAGVGLAQAGDKVRALKSQIDELTESMKKNADAVKAGALAGTAGVGGQISAFANIMSSGLVGTGGSEQAAANQVKMAGQLRVLTEALKQAQHEQDQLKNKSAAYVSTLADMGNPLDQTANRMNRSASEIEKVGSALGPVDASMEEVAAMANKMGVSYVQAASVMSNQNNILKAGVENLSVAFGTTLGNAIMGAKDAWKEGLRTMIGAVFDAATQVVLAAAVMNEAISASLIPGSFAGILGMVVVLQAMKAVAMSALGSASSKANAVGSTFASGSAGASDSSGASGTATGPSGSPISSAQSQVTNNVTVHLPVEAMDLSSVSDMQLKNLANRVGRVLAEASGQGQFSLVGA